MTDDRSEDPLEAALRRELRAASVPFDAARADHMIDAATRAELLEARRTYAPLAAAAAVVLIGGGAAVFASNAGGGGGEPAGGPAPSSSVTPTGAPRGMQTCDGGAAYCSTLQVCVDLGAQASTALPSYVGTYVPLTNQTMEQARRRAVRRERRVERAAMSAAVRREVGVARASALPGHPCPPVPRPAVGSDGVRHVATRSAAAEPTTSRSAGK